MRIKKTPDGRYALGRDDINTIQTFTIKKVAEERLIHLQEEGYEGEVSDDYPYVIYITKSKITT